MDNYIQAQLSEDELFASFIADGHHVPFFALKNFIRAKGFERTVLVSDAINAADCGPGRYTLGDFEVETRRPWLSQARICLGDERATPCLPPP